MRVFVTGASGFIGSSVSRRLVSDGDQVVGLARSAESATIIESLGGSVVRGEIEDTVLLASCAAECDAVVHLAFNHDFSQYQRSGEVDLAAVQSMCGALEGTGKPFLNASGVLGLSPGRVGTETDQVPAANSSPRTASANAVIAAAKSGVRSANLRFAPAVHSAAKQGFAGRLIQIARETGVSGYVGDGAQRWPAIHVEDAATLVAAALRRATGGVNLHAVADEGIPLRTLAEVIGRMVGVPTASIDPDDANSHFGFLAFAVALDSPASNAITRESLGWSPQQPGLVELLESGAYRT